MNTAEITKVFKQQFNGQKNIITPFILSFGKRGKYIYELSTGNDSSGDSIYGVTVLEITAEGYTTRCDLSCCLPDLTEAKKYIKTLAKL